MRKVFIKTHGCQMNEYDSEKMLDLLSAEEQFMPTDNPEDADLLVLNTCSIRAVSYTHLTLPTKA